MNEAVMVALNKATIETLVQDDLRVLIVGGRDTNTSPRLRQQPELVFWDSTDESWKKTASLPTDIGVVLFTRFIRHAESNRITALARKNGIPFFGPLSTGCIRRLLEEALDGQGQAEQAIASNGTPAVVLASPPDYSGLADLLIEHISSAHLEEALLTSDDELTRLVELARSNGYPAVSRQRTVRAVRQILHDLGAITPLPDNFEEQTAHQEPPARLLPPPQDVAMKKEVEELRRRLRKVEGKYAKAREENRKLHKQLAESRKLRDGALGQFKSLLRQVRELGLTIVVSESD